MSISMMIKNRSTGESDEVPISFQSVFNERWLPLGEKLGLETIPLYDGALIARHGETETIINDLLRLRGYLVEHKESQWDNYMIERIGELIERLEEIEANPNLEGSFG